MPPKPAPRYAEIKQVLQAAIETGTQPLGSVLPTEHELGERFGVSRFTVRQALAGLRDLGLIEARPGLGSFVIANRPRSAFVQTLSSIDELLQYPDDTIRQNLATVPVTADADLAQLLHAGPGQDWLHLTAIRRLRHDGTAISFLDAYVLPRFADVLDQPNPGGAPLLRQIAEAHGHHPATAQVEVFASRMPAALAAPMGVAPDSPAMSILRRYRGNDGAVYLVTHSRHPENRFSLNFEFAKT